MILTAIAVTFGLSVLLFALAAVSAPVLNEDGTFEPAKSRTAGLLHRNPTSSL